jgi:hypothetical protein
MKKLFLFLVCMAFLSGCAGLQQKKPIDYTATFEKSAAATKMYGRSVLIGGTKSVDNILYAGLVDGDLCIVITDAKLTYFYRWEDSIPNATAESVPDLIKPDDVGANDGGWELASIRVEVVFGAPQVLVKSAAYDVTVEEAASGAMVYQSGNQVDTGLPAVADGMIVCVFATGADGSAELYLEAGGSDHIDFEGVSAADGEHLRNSSDAKDDYICVMGQGANTWKSWGYRGTWVEETPP